jgi:hypothetical protein
MLTRTETANDAITLNELTPARSFAGAEALK